MGCAGRPRMRASTEPSRSAILTAFETAPVIADIVDGFASNRRVAVRGAVGSSTSFLAAALANRSEQPWLLVVAHPDDADEATDELVSCGVDAIRFPALELSPGDSHVSLDLFAERLRAVKRAQESPPRVMTAPVHAVMQLLPEENRTSHVLREIRVGDAIDLNELVRWLDDAGYARVDAVEDVGEFAVRGGIVDIFPPSASHAEPNPVRLDFFGDELEAIHDIDAATMGSDRAIESVELVSAKTDAVDSQVSSHPITAALGPHWNAIMLEPIELMEQARGYYERVSSDTQVLSPPQVLQRLRDDLHAVVEVSQFATPTDPGAHVLDAPVRSLPPFSTDADEAIGELIELGAECRTIVPCQNQGEESRLGELLRERKSEGSIERPIAYVHRGFIWTDAEGDIAVVPHHELLHRYNTRRRGGRLRVARSLDVFLDLEAGDYAVHQDHGLCRFIGLKAMKRRDSERHEEEFLTLEFAKSASLHVPVSQIDKVQRYVGGFKGKPQLSVLGSKRWKSQKEKVSDAVRDLAGEMLRVQAARAALPGVRYPADTDWQNEFEAEFPYDETEDQLAALAEIKRDMHSPRPMDRLLCGDVGYGKTELGIRAAFKAAEFGKQVAVLVPTTILAEQHERTFRERFAEYPFQVRSLSRFKTAREQKAILNDLRAGRVDIIIGTHRLLSKDVQFADLGLVLVDEEQRFGVEHKQALLSLRMTVDVLTLSATPIPRTLHMSLLGLRDISSLATAPADRRSVVTEVIPYNRERIRRAIARELARDGQIYFVHNRVHSIHRMADEVRNLAPGARIVIGHGQMPSKELEEVMLKFVRRQADILVCTTIIESGVDIPTANTMIITDADRFGLADLHQLRGRVGRYKHRAYCYLLLPENRTITNVAKRRLQAIEEFSMLGAGFKIAMRDLEIRGAGNILGPEQSGHIATVGYEMYCRLLEHAVKELRNDDVTPEPADTVIDLGVSGMLPAPYIPSIKRRIEAYRRIATAQSPEDLVRIERDIQQAYGDLPKAADRLIQLAELRVYASALAVRSVKIDGPDVVFRCNAPKLVADALQSAKGTVRMVAPTRPQDAAEVFLRPPSSHLEPMTLLAILRARLRDAVAATPQTAPIQ